MTEQEKEELRRKIEARKQRETAGTGTVNNNQQTCTGCGSVIPANYDVCPVCGKVLRQGEKLKQQPQMQSGNSDRGKGVAIASLVLGIVGSVLALFGFLVGLWLCVPSFICGIAGLVTAKKAKKNGCISGIRTAGFILSIIAAVLGGIGVIVLIANIAVFMAAISTLEDTPVPEGTKTIDQLGGGATILLQSWFMR